MTEITEEHIAEIIPCAFCGHRRFWHETAGGCTRIECECLRFDETNAA